MISYLQGQIFLQNRGYSVAPCVTKMDYCSIGLLPTSPMGKYIHQRINDYNPDVIIIDGEPLMLHSIRISYPHIIIVTLLNPSDVDNPQNDKEAMDFFNSMYRQANLAIVHGLRRVNAFNGYNQYLSIGTILRDEIIQARNIPSENIYCILGGGTVNVGSEFAETTIRIARLCMEAASLMQDYVIHIICSSDNILGEILDDTPENVRIHNSIMDSTLYYSNASLIITRSGRNTLSELVYLGIPAISFVSGDAYRMDEQRNNIQSINAPNIFAMDTNQSASTLALLCKKAICQGVVQSHFEVGNEKAIKSILALCDDVDK